MTTTTGVEEQVLTAKLEMKEQKGKTKFVSVPISETLT